MKRKILVLVLAATSMSVVSSYGQGKINLNNYAASGNQIVYGGGANAIPGTTLGYGLWNGTPFNGSAGSLS